MKMTLKELREFVKQAVLEEARKSKKKPAPEAKLNPAAKAYGQHAESFDFSQPLGNLNLYKLQGAANFGPYTNSAGVVDPTQLVEYAPDVASTIRGVNEALSQSAWTPIIEMARPPENVWEALIRLEEARAEKKDPTAAEGKKTSSGKK